VRAMKQREQEDDEHNNEFIHSDNKSKYFATEIKIFFFQKNNILAIPVSQLLPFERGKKRKK
jgi:hypothetical protein